MQWHSIRIPILEWSVGYSKGCLDQRKTETQPVKALIPQLHVKYLGLVMESDGLQGLGQPWPPVFLPQHPSSLLNPLHSMPEAFIGGYLMILVSPASWGPHCSLSFPSTTSCSSFPGILLAEILTLSIFDQPQQLSSAIKQNFMPSSILHLACLQNWYKVDNVDKFCCQLGMDPFPLNFSFNDFLVSEFAELLSQAVL